MSTIILPEALRKPRLRRWEAAEYLRLVHGIEVAAAALIHVARLYDSRFNEEPPPASLSLANRYRKWGV